MAKLFKEKLEDGRNRILFLGDPKAIKAKEEALIKEAEAKAKAKAAEK